MHRRGGYQVSPSNTFCHTVAKIFVEEHFGVLENFGYRKILCFRGLCHDFRFSVEIVLSHSAEKIGR